MSFTAITQALNLPATIKGNGRLTAIAIANRVNMHPEYDDQLCAWPSIKGLATDIGASKTAVKSSLNMLEEHGVITRIQRFSNGEKINTLYIWHPWRAQGWDEAAMRRREDKERGYSREEASQAPASPPAPAARARPGGADRGGVCVVGGRWRGPPRSPQTASQSGGPTTPRKSRNSMPRRRIVQP